jgi:dihydroneopterin aldolase
MNEGALFFLLTMQTTDMYIRLEGMNFYAFHGVLPQENLVGANYYIDLRLKTDFTCAAETDELEGTVSYADIHAVIKKEMQTSSKLLEHVCQRIASRLFKDFPTIESIDIALYKENPPMGACAQRIGVEASYRRD